MQVPPRNWIAPPGNNQSSGRGNEATGTFDVKGRISDSTSVRAAICSKHCVGHVTGNARTAPSTIRGRRISPPKEQIGRPSPRTETRTGWQRWPQTASERDGLHGTILVHSLHRVQLTAFAKASVVAYVRHMVDDKVGIHGDMFSFQITPCRRN